MASDDQITFLEIINQIWHIFERISKDKTPNKSFCAYGSRAPMSHSQRTPSLLANSEEMFNQKKNYFIKTNKCFKKANHIINISVLITKLNDT